MKLGRYEYKVKDRIASTNGRNFYRVQGRIVTCLDRPVLKNRRYRFERQRSEPELDFVSSASAPAFEDGVDFAPFAETLKTLAERLREMAETTRQGAYRPGAYRPGAAVDPRGDDLVEFIEDG